MRQGVDSCIDTRKSHTNVNQPLQDANRDHYFLWLALKVGFDWVLDSNRTSAQDFPLDS